MNFWKKMVKFRAVGLACGGGLTVILSGWLWAYASLKNIPRPLILFFSNYPLPVIKRTGDLGDLAALAVFGVLVVVVNYLIALTLEERDWFWGKLTAATTLFFALLIFIAFAAIISVN